MSLRRVFPFALAVILASVAFAFASPAGAVDNPDYSKPTPEVLTKNATPAAVQPASAVRSVTASRQRLAITGSDVSDLLVIGAVLVAGGTATLMVRRRAIA